MKKFKFKDGSIVTASTVEEAKAKHNVMATKSVETAKDIKAFLKQLPKCISNDAGEYDENPESMYEDLTLSANFVDFEDLGLINVDLAFIKKVAGKYYVAIKSKKCSISNVKGCKKLLADEVKRRLDSLKTDFDKVSKSYEKVINALG